MPETINPVRISTQGAPLGEKRVPIFYIDDKEYDAPERVPARIALRALEIAATQSEAAAAFFCLIEAIGEQAYKDLLECEHVTYEQAQEIMSNLAAMYYGQAKALAGK